MRPSSLLLTALLSATMLWRPSESYYKYKTERRMGAKLRHLTRELVLDVERKILAVQSFRDQYYKALQYQLGDIVYHLRHFFKLQVRLYQIAHRDVMYGHGNFHKAILTLIEIQRMAMEIEFKVRMVQTWQGKRENKLEHKERMLDPLRMGAPRHDEHEPLREVAARARMQRGGGARPPRPAPAPRAPHAPPAPQRLIKKWRHVSDQDFQRMRI